MAPNAPATGSVFPVKVTPLLRQWIGGGNETERGVSKSLVRH